MRYEKVYVSERGTIKVYHRDSHYLLEINEDLNRQTLISEEEFKKMRDRFKLKEMLMKLDE